MNQTKRSKGFTLIELMIVVAIIGILAAVAIPKFADLVTKSKEASAKGSLGAVRSAISIYYGDTEGVYPANLFEALTGGNKYMPPIQGTPSLGRYELPRNNNGNPGHTGGFFGNNNAVGGTVQNALTEGAPSLSYWVTGSTAAGTSDGDVLINCTHQDTKSSGWSTY